MRYALMAFVGFFTATALVFGAGGVAADFPAPQRESIEWCDIWFTSAEKADLPRVLLIGDSITRGYYDPVEKSVGNRAYCGRYTTSRSVCDPVFFQELGLVLGQYDYAVIHVNNGLHGWGYTEDEYRAGLLRLLDALEAQAPEAEIIWASTTPVSSESGMADHQERVDARNSIARELMHERGVAIDDLHPLAVAHPDFLGRDGVHFTGEGCKALGAQVATHVAAALARDGA
jgi:lysophospholipase L1-like esterase